MKKVIFILLLCSLCFAETLTPIQLNFNSGELSPLMYARSDLPKYSYGCKTLQNMFVIAQGPSFKRPGTQMIAEVNDSSKFTRIIPFIFSNTDAYIIEVGNHYMRFYRNGGQILDGNDPYEISTSFLEDELSGIQYDQTGDLMYLAQVDHWLQKLIRSGHTSWAIEDVNIVDGPFLPENDTNTTITPSDVNGTITLVADANIFDEGHVGALWKISERRSQTTLSGILDANEESSTISVEGDWKAYTGGTWTGLVTVERSFDNGSNWETVPGAIVYSENNSNLEYDDTETEFGVIYRFKMENFSSGKCNYILNVYSQWQSGIAKIASYVDANEVTATVLVELAGTDATVKWSEGAWSAVQGYPSALTFFQQRLILASSGHRLPRLWGSASFNFETFATGEDADDPFNFKLATARANPIMWLADQKNIIIGTSGAEHSFGPPGSEGTLTPSDYETFRHDTCGSEPIKPILANNAVIFVEHGGRKLRHILYSATEYSYATEDLSKLAEHITSPSITQIAFQKRPEPIIWCVRNDGVLLTVSYDRIHSVVAWSKHPMTNGYVEDIAVIPSNSTDQDEVWFVVRRIINGQTKRYIEKLSSWNLDPNSIADCFYVDSGLSFDGGDAVDISNISVAGDGKITVTVDSWPVDGDDENIADGDQIKISSIVGTTELNNKVFTVSDANVTAKTFILKDSGNTFYWNGSEYGTYTSGGTVQKVEKDFTGLSHLEGETVQILADGFLEPDETVTSGEVSINNWSNKAHIGLGYTAQLTTMDMQWMLQAGTSRGKQIRLDKVTLDFYKTATCKYGSDTDNLMQIDFRQPSDPVNQPVPLYSGLWDEDWKTGYKKEYSITLVQDEPLPIVIRAIIPEVGVY